MTITMRSRTEVVHTRKATIHEQSSNSSSGLKRKGKTRFCWSFKDSTAVLVCNQLRTRKHNGIKRATLLIFQAYAGLVMARPDRRTVREERARRATNPRVSPGCNGRRARHPHASASASAPGNRSAPPSALISTRGRDVPRLPQKARATCMVGGAAFVG